MAHFVVELQVPALLDGFHQMGPRLLKFAAGVVGNLLNQDRRFRDGPTVERPARQWSRPTVFPGAVLIGRMICS